MILLALGMVVILVGIVTGKRSTRVSEVLVMLCRLLWVLAACVQVVTISEFYTHDMCPSLWYVILQ